jgi:hypothetical protein
MSHLRVKKPEEMSRQEFEEWSQMVELDKNNIDISTDHQLIKVIIWGYVLGVARG